jgi:hypothetical protein
MKRFLVLGAACVLVSAIGLSIYLWIEIRNEGRRVLRVTDIEGYSTEVYQPLVSRYISGPCSGDVCPYREVSGLRIEDGPGNLPADILWAQLRSITFIPPEDVEPGAHPSPKAIFRFRDGRAQKASVSSYQLHGETEIAPYRVSIGDLKTIMVAEGDKLEHPHYSSASVDDLQITDLNGRTQSWSAWSETEYPTVFDGRTYYRPATNARGGIRLWQGKASFDIEWARIREASVEPVKGFQGQAVLRIKCIFSNGQTADFTIDPAPGPRISEQLGPDKYNQVKLEDIRRILVNMKSTSNRR